MARRRFHHCMTRLALLAMLLLALLPTLGRLQASASDALPPHAEAVFALCTVNRLVPAVLDATSLATRAASELPASAGDDDSTHVLSDCQYCPLLAGLALVIPALLAGLGVAHGLPSLPRAQRGPQHTLFIPGLGSRGPPAALPTACIAI